jgi:hypothetical protein
MGPSIRTCHCLIRHSMPRLPPDARVAHILVNHNWPMRQSSRSRSPSHGNIPRVLCADWVSTSKRARPTAGRPSTAQGAQSRRGGKLDDFRRTTLADGPSILWATRIASRRRGSGRGPLPNRGGQADFSCGGYLPFLRSAFDPEIAKLSTFSILELDFLIHFRLPAFKSRLR